MFFSTISVDVSDEWDGFIIACTTWINAPKIISSCLLYIISTFMLSTDNWQRGVCARFTAQHRHIKSAYKSVCAHMNISLLLLCVVPWRADHQRAEQDSRMSKTFQRQPQNRYAYKNFNFHFYFQMFHLKQKYLE